MELQQYLNILRERWLSAALVALVVVGAVSGYTFLQTPSYQATNRLFVQTQASGSVADLNSGVNFASQQITTYADLATSPLVLDPVIDELGLQATPTSLAQDISTTVPPETLILEITATSEDPAEAAAVANSTAASLQNTVDDLESDGAESSVELTIVAPATEPGSPVSPNVLRNIALGVVLAVLAGIATAIVRDLLDTRVRRPEDIEKSVDRPVLAGIPMSKNAKQLPLIAARHPHSLQAEAFRELRTNMQFLGFTEGKRSILVTSSIPGEGKSSSAINLAHVLAQSGAHVLLVDADLRRPALASYLGLEGGAGLTTVLIGEVDLEDVVQPVDKGLDVLASGQIPPNPSELLGSGPMERLLKTATDSYDYVVVDTAPLLAVTDAAVLSGLTGGTLVVAQSERVARPQLRRAVEKLDAVEARVLGVVLNRVSNRTRDVYSYQYTYEPQAEIDKTIPTPPPRPDPTSEPTPEPNGPRTGRTPRDGKRRAQPGPPASSGTSAPKPWPCASTTSSRR